MYNYDQYTDLIKRLRKLHKLSQTVPEDAGQTAADRQAQETKLAVDDLNETFARGKTIAALYKEQLDILGSGFGDLQHGLSVIAAQQEAYNTSISNLVKEVTFFDEVEANIAKTLKISTSEAYKQTQTYGTFLETLKTTRESLDTYRTTLNSILPGQSANIAQSKEYAQTLLSTQQHLQDFQGLTADQAAAYTLYTEGSGKNIARQLHATSLLADAWENATGLTGQYNTILTEISNMSADIRSEYSRTNGELELAVLKSKRLGMTMTQLDKIGTGLLNIEESVGKEIEFQLISGRRLVDAQGQSITNKFREAKLTGNSLKMTEAMTDVITQQGDIIKGNNFLAKKALADSLDMTVQELVVAKQRYDIAEKLASTTKKTKKELEELEPGSEAEKAFRASLEHEIKIAGSQDAIDKAKENLNLLNNLNESNKNLETPAQKTARYLQNIVDNGIFIKMPKTKDKEGKTIYEERSKFDVAKLAKTVEGSKTTALMQNEGFLKLVGTTQTLSKLKEADTNLLISLSAIAPGISVLTTAMNGLTDTIMKNFPIFSSFIKNALNILPAGTPGKAQKLKGPWVQQPDAEKTGDLSIDANGGPIVMSLKENRIFQGTKNDEVAMYPGAVDVATANNSTKNYNVTNNIDKVNYNKIENIVETALQLQLSKINIKPNITVNNTDTNKVVNTDTKNLERIVGSIQTEISKINIKPNIINNVEVNKNNIDSINNSKIENTIRTAIQTEISKINIKPNSNKNIDYTDKLEKIANMFEIAVSKLNSTSDTNTIISAIKTAFSGVEISVHVDPVKINKEIKFRDTRINR